MPFPGFPVFFSAPSDNQASAMYNLIRQYINQDGDKFTLQEVTIYGCFLLEQLLSKTMRLKIATT